MVNIQQIENILACMRNKKKKITVALSIPTKLEKLFTKSQTWETEQLHYNHVVEYYAAVKNINTPPTKTHVVVSRIGLKEWKKAKGILMLYSLLRQGNACTPMCAPIYLYTCYSCQRRSSLMLNGRLEQKERFSSDQSLYTALTYDSWQCFHQLNNTKKMCKIQLNHKLGLGNSMVNGLNSYVKETWELR